MGIILKWIFKNMLQVCRLDEFGMGEGQNNEFLGSIKCGEFADYLRNS
jgi:hypothetical protein